MAEKDINASIEDVEEDDTEYLQRFVCNDYNDNFGCIMSILIVVLIILFNQFL